MLVVVSYDVDTTDASGRRRLRRIAKTCQNSGQRVQFSVFECEVTPADWVKLRTRLLEEMMKPKTACASISSVPTASGGSSMRGTASRSTSTGH